MGEVVAAHKVIEMIGLQMLRTVSTTRLHSGGLKTLLFSNAYGLIYKLRPRNHSICIGINDI